METILVVHSQRHIGQLIEVNLQRAGFQTFIAINTVDALRLTQEYELNLMVSDSTLTELQKALQDNSGARDIPVVLLHPNEELDVDALR